MEQLEPRVVLSGDVWVPELLVDSSGTLVDYEAVGISDSGRFYWNADFSTPGYFDRATNELFEIGNLPGGGGALAYALTEMNDSGFGVGRTYFGNTYLIIDHGFFKLSDIVTSIEGSATPRFDSIKPIALSNGNHAILRGPSADWWYHDGVLVELGFKAVEVNSLGHVVGTIAEGDTRKTVVWTHAEGITAKIDSFAAPAFIDNAGNVMAHNGRVWSDGVVHRNLLLDIVSRSDLAEAAYVLEDWTESGLYAVALPAERGTSTIRLYTLASRDASEITIVDLEYYAFGGAFDATDAPARSLEIGAEFLLEDGSITTTSPDRLDLRRLATTTVHSRMESSDLLQAVADLAVGGGIARVDGQDYLVVGANLDGGYTATLVVGPDGAATVRFNLVAWQASYTYPALVPGTFPGDPTEAGNFGQTSVHFTPAAEWELSQLQLDARDSTEPTSHDDIRRAFLETRGFESGSYKVDPFPWQYYHGVSLDTIKYFVTGVSPIERGFLRPDQLAFSTTDVIERWTTSEGTFTQKTRFALGYDDRFLELYRFDSLTTLTRTINGEVVELEAEFNEYAGYYGTSRWGSWHRRDVPEFVGQMEMITTDWGTLHIIGHDAEGQLISWWGRLDASPDEWSAATLSTEGFTGEFSAFVTPWNAMNIVGTDADGNVKATWWAPGRTGWTTSNLTAASGGRTVEIGSVTTALGAGNSIVMFGIGEGDGSIEHYWWAPWTRTWTAETLSDRLSTSIGSVGGPLTAFSGTSQNNLVYASDDGDIMRLYWTPDSNGWQSMNLSNIEFELL